MEFLWMVAVLAMLLAVQQSEVTLTSLKILAPEGRATDGRSLKNGQVGDVGTEDKGSLGSTEGYKDLADVAGGAEYFDEVEGYEGYDSEGERESYEGISSMQDMFLLKEGGKVKYTVSYPPAKYRFHKHMLNKTLCDRYTLECIDYRLEYPYGRLRIDAATGKEYNACHQFVEPCFGISAVDYCAIKKFKTLRDY